MLSAALQFQSSPCAKWARAASRLAILSLLPGGEGVF